MDKALDAYSQGMRRIAKLLSICLMGASCLTTACATETDTPSPTEPEPETTIPQQDQLSLSRESLLALEKCTSETSGVYLYIEGVFPDGLSEVAELCAEARDQLAVDARLNPDFKEEIEAYLIDLGFWIATLSIAVLDLRMGNESTVGIRSATNEFASKSEAFYELVSP